VSIKSQESNQPNLNLTIKTAEKVEEELNRSSENIDKKGWHSRLKSKIKRVLKETMGKQSNSFSVY
jgi:hypothetical protein